MGRVTVDLIRKRAEHNEGQVATLREVSLHQQELERIEVLGQVCKHLEILYLQNNLIPRIENVHRLKELKYLNLALNNIRRIEGLERCESLEKLDLTVNFIPKEGLLDAHLLSANRHLRELYLLGNPCADWHGYRRFVIASIPQLCTLDGKSISPSERIQAEQDFPLLKESLIEELKSEGIDPDSRPPPIRPGDEEETEEDDGDEDPHAPRPWTPQTRLKEHKEMKKQREESEKPRAEALGDLSTGSAQSRLPARRTTFDPLPENGELPYQKNEGGWSFSLREAEDERSILLEVPVGKYLDTSLVDVDVQPYLVRCLIKGRLLQLRLPDEVQPGSSKAERSTVSGDLLVTMPKSSPLAGRSKLAKKGERSNHPATKTVKSEDLRGQESQTTTLTPSLSLARASVRECDANDDDDDDDDPPPPL